MAVRDGSGRRLEAAGWRLFHTPPRWICATGCLQSAVSGLQPAVIAADAGKAVFEVTAVEELVDDLRDDGPQEAVTTGWRLEAGDRSRIIQAMLTYSLRSSVSSL